MKTCNICKENKPLTEFARNKSRHGPYCHPCRREYDKKMYNTNKDRELARKKTERASVRKRNHLIMVEAVKDGCVDCGEKDIRCLEFDHEDPKTKSFSLSKGRSDCISKERIEQEMAKCKVRCANCHRKRTANQFGWYKQYI